MCLHPAGPCPLRLLLAAMNPARETPSVCLRSLFRGAMHTGSKHLTFTFVRRIRENIYQGCTKPWYVLWGLKLGVCVCRCVCVVRTKPDSITSS